MRTLIALSLLVVAASGARAAVVFDNGTPNAVTAVFSDNDFTFTGGRVQATDDFTLAASSALVHVTLYWITNTGAFPPTSDFEISFFADLAGTPDTTALASHLITGVTGVDTGLDIFTSDVYRFEVFFPQTLLGPGTFWLSAVEFNGDGVNWSWATSNAAANTFVRDPAAPGDPWNSPQPVGLAFQLHTVPEPSTLALLGLALAGLAGRRRRD